MTCESFERNASIATDLFGSTTRRCMFDPKFAKTLKKLDNSVFIKVAKQVEKINNHPEIGKRMVANRKDTREVYVRPFRLYYTFSEEENLIIFREFSHKKYQ